MDKIILKAYAKINLSIDVLGKRSDGYHELEMVNQTINLSDAVTIQKSKSNLVNINCNIPNLAKDNIIYKITDRMIKQYNIEEGIDIELIKKIPISAGLGGGSADAAAVLKGVNNLFGLGLSDEKLSSIGAEIGADIPYCLIGGTALVKGIGEKITALPSLPKTTILVCKPQEEISTSYVFEKLCMNQIKERPQTQAIINSIYNKNIDMLSKQLVNVLETVTSKKYPIIEEIKMQLIKNGAAGASMSGSGTSVFGIFKDRRTALKSLNILRKFSKEIFLTSTK